MATSYATGMLFMSRHGIHRNKLHEAISQQMPGHKSTEVYKSSALWSYTTALSCSTTASHATRTSHVLQEATPYLALYGTPRACCRTHVVGKPNCSKPILEQSAAGSCIRDSDAPSNMLQENTFLWGWLAAPLAGVSASPAASNICILASVFSDHSVLFYANERVLITTPQMRADARSKFSSCDPCHRTEAKQIHPVVLETLSTWGVCTT